MQNKTPLGRRFWGMWGAIAASSLGDGIFSVALPLLALQFTRNPLSIAGIVIAGQVPVLLAALPVGAIADRLNRRTLMVTIEVVRFAVLAGLGIAVLMHHANLGLIYAAAFALGGLNIAFDVVGGACLPSIVHPDNLVKANAHLLNAEMTAENLVGQAVGGLAFAVSRSLPFLANAASLVASASLLNRSIPDNEPAGGDSTAWQDLREGLKWFRQHPLLRQLTSVIATLAFCQGIVLGLLAIYAKEQLHLSSAGYGLLLAAASIGTVFGGLAASRLHDRIGAGPTILFAAVGFGAAYFVLALTHSALIAGAALLLQEGTVIIGNTASRSLRQKLVPPNMQGRASSAYMIVILGCVPLGSLLGGLLGGATSVRAAFMAAGVLQAGFLVLTAPRLLARIREAQADKVVSIIDLTEPEEAEGAQVPAQVPAAVPAGRANYVAS